MGTLTERFPDDIARGAEGSHGNWDVTNVPHAGGQETSNLNSADGLGEWNVARALERSGKHEIVRSHYFKARGEFHRFRFKDWLDFRCARTGDDKGRLTGSTTAWQINKVYGADEATFEYVRPLKRIVSGSVRIWKDTVLQTLTTHYTVDINTGIVTSLSSWAGTTLEVSCEFDVLCRYNSKFEPRLDYRLSDAEMLVRVESLLIKEVRE
jgi:uncharacterized protein (TIGR02217 family)